MPEELLMLNSGVQTIIPETSILGPQIVYLDFDGAETSYRNRELDITIDNIIVNDSGFDIDDISLIVDALNEEFGEDIVFTADLPQIDEYSTVFVGKTDAFADYGSFLGLAETIDTGNQIRNDNAFVLLDSTASVELVTSVIAHETEHIVSGLDHGGIDLQRFAWVSSVTAGQIASNMIISSGNTLYVSSGGTANSTIVNYYGRMYVSSGGTANSTTVNSSGYLFVSSGGTANYTTVNSGGGMYASSGGTANATTVSSEGDLYIYSGGTANYTTVSSGYLYVRGGTANYTTVSSGYLYVHGGTANYTTVNRGSLYVSSGGTANYTTVNRGSLYVSSGGTANYTTVSGGGDLYVSSGGVANSTTVNSGGSLYVRGVANSTTVNYGGYLDVRSGGTVLNIDWTPFVGRVEIADGAKVTFKSSYSGCYVGVGDVLRSSAMIITGKTVSSSGVMYVFSGGTANSTTVNYYGSMRVFSGGTANYTTVSSAGYLDVRSGGTANSTTVTYYGSMRVFSGGTANYTTVSGGGDLYVSSGGVANSTNISSGGDLYVSSGGTANYTTVNRGSLYVSSGGTAQGIVEDGGCVRVYAGATVNFVSHVIQNRTVLYGSMTVHSGTTANSTTVNSLGCLGVSSGGTANYTTVSGGGDLYVSSGGVANSTTVNSGGSLYVSSGGTAQGIVEDGGCVRVYAGATVNFVSHVIQNRTVLYGSMTVHSGTTANSTTVNSQGSLYVSSGGTANATTVSSGYLVVSSGGMANSTTVNYSGSMDVFSGGTANYTTVNRGSLVVYSSGTANSTNISSGGDLYVGSGGTAIYTTVTGGDLYVSSGGTVIYTTVNSRGWMYISSGGTANSTNISSGGVYVSSGGTANYTTVNRGSLVVYSGGVANSTTVNSGGSLYVRGGVANSTTVNYGGYLDVDSGGTANATTVSSGGYLYIHSGGTANYTTVNSGHLFVARGGTALNVINSNGRVTGVVVGNDTATRLQGRNADGTEFFISKGIAYNISGSLDVSSGGTANSTTVNSGDFLNVSSGGMATAMTVSSGGSIFVYSGGTANDTTVNSGYLFVARGGTALNVINSNGRVTGVVVGNDTATRLQGRNADGTEFFISKGIAYNISGSLYVSSGGTANSTTVNSGDFLYVSSGGMATAMTVSSGGSIFVYSGGVANAATVFGGFLYVSSGGKALNVINSNGSVGGCVVGNDSATRLQGWNADGTEFFISNGVAYNICGDLDVKSGGTAKDTTVSSGYLYVSSGGTAQGIVEDGGCVTVYAGATVNFVSHVIQNRTVLYGSMTVHSGTTANDTTVNSGGSLMVYSGGTANDTTVNSGGYLYVSSGGTANSTTVNCGGALAISRGGMANSTTVRYGGTMYVFSGGTALKVIEDGGFVSVKSGASVTFVPHVIESAIINEAMTIHSGTTANSVTVNSGGSLLLYSGGSVTTLVVNGGIIYNDGIIGKLSVEESLEYQGAGTVNQIDFSVSSENNNNATPLVNTFTNAMSYSISIKAEAGFDGGRWLLAGNWGNDAFSIPVYSALDGSLLGMLFSTNPMISIEGYGTYELSLDQDKLYLDYTCWPKPPTATASITIPTKKNVVVSATFRGELAAKQYSLDNETWQDYTTGITMTANGTVYFRGIDKAGNFSEVTSYEVTNIDKVPPAKPTASADITTLTNQDVIVTATFSEDTVRKQYTLDKKTWSTYTTGITMTANGTVYFRGIDEAGNISSATSYKVTNIDKTPPEVPIALGDITAATNQSVTVTATFSEDSVIRQYSTNNRTWNDYISDVVMASNGTVFFRGIDAVGNISEVASYEVTNIDKTAPDKPAVSASTTAPVNLAVIVTADFSNDSTIRQYSFDGQTWKEYTSAVSMSFNGIVYFRALDEVGNVSKITSYEVTNIDKIPPVKPMASAEITTLTNQDVIVTAVFSEDSVTRQYSLDNSVWSSYTDGVAMSANGTVYFRGIDEAGNISEVNSYEVTNIDKVTPKAPTATANITEPTNQSVTVTATFSEDSVKKQYSTDNKTWKSYSASGVARSSNGTVYFRGFDEAGNISDVTSYNVTNIDKIAPVISGVSADVIAFTNGMVTVTATARDEKNAVTLYYAKDGGEFNEYANGVVFGENGSVNFQAVDAAGNVSEISNYEVTNIDKTAPAVVAGLEATGDRNTILFSWQATTDNLSGVSGYEIEVSGDSDFSSIIASQAGADLLGFSASFTQSGTYHYRVRGVDAVGNASDWSTASVEFEFTDEVPPTLPVGLSVTAEGREVTFSWNASADDDSGVAGYEVTVGKNGRSVTQTTTETSLTLSLDEGNYSWGVTARDAFGNETEMAEGEGFKVLEPISGAPAFVNLPESPSETLVQGSTADDVFALSPNGEWGTKHVAFWNGKDEKIRICGRQRYYDAFDGAGGYDVIQLAAGDNALLFADLLSPSATDANAAARLANISEIRGGDGRDVIDMTAAAGGYAGDLLLKGGGGDDHLWSGDGGDVLIGGNGNDDLRGGAGKDIYLFGAGWGNDTIVDDGGTLVFDNALQGKLTVSGNVITDGTNSVTVNWSVSDADIVFADVGELSEYRRNTIKAFLA